MDSTWISERLESEDEFARRMSELRARGWVFRGQSRLFKGLHPSIDRGPFGTLSRGAKLELEKNSVKILRSVARSFAPGEEGSMESEFVAMAVLRHYLVPTRLLDWSGSPWTAAFFAVSTDVSEDGEIWAFDRKLYELRGRAQWRRWPETTQGRTGNPEDFLAELTAFDEIPPDWFACMFYPQSFPRQRAQEGLYSLTANFGRDHAEAIQALLADPEGHRRIMIPARLKPTLKELLLERFDVWRGSLMPDCAGASEIAKLVFETAVAAPTGH